MVTVVLDCTLGTYLTCLILINLEDLFKKNGLEFLKSGNYYKTSSIKKVLVMEDLEGTTLNVPFEIIEIIEIQYLVWFLQLSIWLTIIIISKAVVFLI